MGSFKSFFLALTVLSLTACAFDKNTNVDVQREIDDRNALYEKYNRVTGVYTGTVMAGTATQNVEVSFYTIEKKKGETADGQPRFLPSLMARYRVLNTVDIEDVIMEVKYLEETSEVFMSNSIGDFGIQASFHGTDLRGEVTRNGGKWGTLQSSLVSRESSAPNDANSRAERDARLRSIFQPIVGPYSGKVSFSKNSPTPSFNAKITLVIGQVKDKDGYYMPSLQGYYTPQNSNDNALSLALNVDYKPDVNPPYISLVSYESKVDYTVTISASIQNGVIEGDFTNKRGHVGKVRFVKQP